MAPDLTRHARCVGLGARPVPLFSPAGRFLFEADADFPACLARLRRDCVRFILMTRSSTRHVLPAARHPFLRSLRATPPTAVSSHSLIDALAAPDRWVAHRKGTAFGPFFIAPAALVLATPPTPRLLSDVPRHFPAAILLLSLLLRRVLAARGGQDFFDDAGRYDRGIPLCRALASGDLPGVAGVAALPAHALFP